jgi:hypothetical protein
MKLALLHFLFFISLIFNTYILAAQNSFQTQGIIVDSTSYNTIEFVCVGIIGKDVGTISNEMGFYNLTIPKQYFNDTITFSRIGYQTKFVIAKDLIERKNIKTVLIPKNTELGEVLISSKGTKAKTKGNTSRSRSFVMAISSGSVGSEVGTVIHLPNDSVFIKDLNFHILSDKPDSVKFRLNIYGFNKGVGDNIINKSIYFTISNKYIGDFKVDLRKYHLYLSGKIFISVEPISVFSKGPDPNNSSDKNYDRINISGTITGSESFYRKVSLGRWTKIKYSFSPGLWVTYLD